MQRKITSCLMLVGIIFFASQLPAYAGDLFNLDKAAIYRNETLDGGKLSPVMLLSYDGKDYYLAQNEETKKLESLVEHTINVEGSLAKDAKGRNVLTITSFKEAFN
jgi:hypothetical protein